MKTSEPLLSTRIPATPLLGQACVLAIPYSTLLVSRKTTEYHHHHHHENLRISLVWRYRLCSTMTYCLLLLLPYNVAEYLCDNIFWTTARLVHSSCTVHSHIQLESVRNEVLAGILHDT
jgi:hypothetical protein